ncbi:MAG TPA: hypothetical protein DD711_02770 [Acidimicrobium sp.]|nr:hypothetical protein [Acidimicrobium sp.]
MVVKLKIKEGQRDAMTDAVKPGIETAKGEVGTRFYAFHHDAVDVNTVWFYELYADQDAANLHMGSEAFKTWSKTLAPFVDGAPEFSFLTPIGGKGI